MIVNHILVFSVAVVMAVSATGCKVKRSSSSSTAVQVNNRYSYTSSYTYTSTQNGRVVKLTSDTAADFRPDPNGAIIQFGDQKIEVTRSAVLHNGTQVVSLDSSANPIALSRSGQTIEIETDGKAAGRIQLP